MDAKRSEECRKTIAALILREHRRATEELIRATADLAAYRAGKAAREAAELEQWGPSCGPGFHDSRLEYLEKNLPTAETYKRYMDDVVEVMSLTFCEKPPA